MSSTNPGILQAAGINSGAGDQEPNDLQLGATGHPVLPTPAPTGAPVAPDAPNTQPDGNPLNDVSGLDGKSINFTPTHVQAAQGMMEALQKGDGGPADWAKSAVSGMISAIGNGNVGKVPAGAGWLYGATKAAGNAADAKNAKVSAAKDAEFKQQELDLQKQKATNEQGNFDKDYQLKVSENARQQAESYQRLAEHDYRMQQISDAHNRNNFDLMRDEVKFRQENLDRENALKEAGASILKIGGQDTPEFDDLGQAAQYAKQNHADVIASNNGHNTRYEMGADGKYRIYEVPDDGPKDYTYTDADGHQVKAHTTAAGLLALQDKVADIKYKNAQASKDYATASKDWSEYRDTETAKKARKELTDVNGDYSKLSPGAKDALTNDAQKSYGLAYDKLRAGQSEMMKDPGYSALPTDAQGNVDMNSTAYQSLATKYKLNEAEQDVNDSYDELRQLRHGYKAPGSADTTQPAPAQAAPPAAVAGFRSEQTAKADAAAQQATDAQKAIDEREADSPTTVRTSGRNAVSIPNPAFNEAEKYISEHKDLTGPERAQIRADFAKNNAKPQGNVPTPPQRGATINAAQFKQYLDANGGDLAKAKAAALSAGWQAPQ